MISKQELKFRREESLINNNLVELKKVEKIAKFNNIKLTNR